jgi:hypothetical protein
MGVEFAPCNHPPMQSEQQSYPDRHSIETIHASADTLAQGGEKDQAMADELREELIRLQLTRLMGAITRRVRALHFMPGAPNDPVASPLTGSWPVEKEGELSRVTSITDILIKDDSRTLEDDDIQGWHGIPLHTTREITDVKTDELLWLNPKVTDDIHTRLSTMSDDEIWALRREMFGSAEDHFLSGRVRRERGLLED